MGYRWFAIILLGLSLSSVLAYQIEIPQAEIENDEGGVSVIVGNVTYTNPFFSVGVTEPLIMLEDQTGFVQRNPEYELPTQSQIVGYITTDFTQSPFSYRLQLPRTPNAPLNDINFNDQDDTGVMVFQVAFWSNIFGDSYIQPRDQYGRAWSRSYSSAAVSSSSENLDEYTGGKIIAYAPDDQQAFPSGFGEDNKLFTDDDPLVIIPQGFTAVDMNTTPFTFNRSHTVTINLIESASTAADNFSMLGFAGSFDAMLEKFRNEYAFTDYKNVDWDALEQEYRPQFEAVEIASEYNRLLQEFIWEIPDEHLSMTFTPSLVRDFFDATDGGIGIAVRELSDGRVVVVYLTENSLAADSGLQIGTEIIAINGVPISDAIENKQAWSAPFSTQHVRRLQQLRYVTRFAVGEEITMTYRNPDEEAQTTNFTTVFEPESFSSSSFSADETGFELPVEYTLLDNNILYAEITDFLDDSHLTIQLWERMLRNARLNNITALVIDMRNNGGGRAYIAHQMAAYFYDEPIIIGNTERYDPYTDTFFADPTPDRFYLPPENLRFRGKVVVLVGPNCSSSCEFFSYAMTLQDRATIVGHYPTGGLGGSVEQFFMPGGVTVQMTTGRVLDADGNIHVEGKGVAPDVVVPVTEESLLGDNDAVLEAAIQYILGDL